MVRCRLGASPTSSLSSRSSTGTTRAASRTSTSTTSSWTSTSLSSTTGRWLDVLRRRISVYLLPVNMEVGDSTRVVSYIVCCQKSNCCKICRGFYSKLVFTCSKLYVLEGGGGGGVIHFGVDALNLLFNF